MGKGVRELWGDEICDEDEKRCQREKDAAEDDEGEIFDDVNGI